MLGVGTKLGTYEIASHIGSGGMGEVYQAHDSKLGRDVAVKVLPERFALDSERLSRFQREATLLAALNHPNIATIHGLEQSGDTHYLVMELVPGETLGQKIKHDGALPIEEALKIAKQIAEALEAAHNSEKGIIHRDLKPANVKVTPEGRVKVLDFGLAKAFAVEAEYDDSNVPTLSALPTMPGTIMGTWAYMSPEQARAGRVDRRTDIWAFGCVLYEMLTAKRAFHGNTTQDQIAGVLAREIDWQALPPNTPGKIRDLLRGCLQKDPQNRLQDFRAVKNEIEKASHQSVVIRSQHVIAAAAAIVLVIGLGGWLYRRSEQRQWVREEAIPEITRLAGEKKTLAAFLVLRQAEQYEPGNPQLMQIDRNSTRDISVQSTPPGAKVEIQDYSSPNGGAWFSLGATPLEHAKIPKGYFRWKISKPGAEELVAAPFTTDAVQFSLQPAGTQTGMVSVPGGHWGDLIGFVGWLRYDLPPFDVDRFEVTNHQYQQFVDRGGYTKREYWKQPFIKDGKELTWEQAMELRLADSLFRVCFFEGLVSKYLKSLVVAVNGPEAPE